MNVHTSFGREKIIGVTYSPEMCIQFLLAAPSSKVVVTHFPRGNKHIHVQLEQYITWDVHIEAMRCYERSQALRVRSFFGLVGVENTPVFNGPWISTIGVGKMRIRNITSQI